jgi:thymidine kinase
MAKLINVPMCNHQWVTYEQKAEYSTMRQPSGQLVSVMDKLTTISVICLNCGEKKNISYTASNEVCDDDNCV